ncbi:MAG TPA: FecR domain-containing protein [Xanthobacteraceae bacterium]|nr:FecR domain-containing protein [Xanthobacteraceae bacterium]
MKAISFALTAAAACSALALYGAARAEPTIGKATSVVPAANYTRGTQLASLSVDDAVQQDDRVKTSAKGSTEIKFVDGTRLTIGPNSEVALDKMIFDGGKARNATVQLVRGAMRFASGNSDHSAYHIETKVATIGVRGTVIDVSYENDKMIYSTVEGDAEVCNRNTGAGCRRVRAGDPALAVTLRGFTRATAREALKLFRGMNGVSRTLTKSAALFLKNGGHAAGKAAGHATKAVGRTTRDIGHGVGEGLKRTLHLRPPF